MDKIIQSGKRKKFRWIIGIGVSTLICIGIVFLFSASGKSQLKIDKSRITIDTVKILDFHEYIVVSGNVQPLHTFYLHTSEGGQIAEIFTDNGSLIEAGTPILRLDNSSLQMNYINREAEILEQLNVLRSTQINLEEKRLNLQSELLQTRYELGNAKTLYNRNKNLFEKKAISEAEFLPVKENFQFLVSKEQLILEKIKQDSLLTRSTLNSIKPSMALMEKNLLFIEESLNKLTLKAPVDGQLSALTGEIGQYIQPGQLLAQIDIWDGFKVKASVEEFYLGRIFQGQKATHTENGETYTLAVSKIYPEVTNGRFNLDLIFEGTQPANMRRGQTLNIQIPLGGATQTRVVARGGFITESGGNWVFVVTDDGNSAFRRNLKTGRQNPDYIEILEGLEEGDRIITSGYENYADMQQLILQ